MVTAAAVPVSHHLAGNIIRLNDVHGVRSASVAALARMRAVAAEVGGAAAAGRYFIGATPKFASILHASEFSLCPDGRVSSLLLMFALLSFAFLSETTASSSCHYNLQCHPEPKFL